jgi:hypothetical protein
MFKLRANGGRARFHMTSHYFPMPDFNFTGVNQLLPALASTLSNNIILQITPFNNTNEMKRNVNVETIFAVGPYHL